MSYISLYRTIPTWASTNLSLIRVPWEQCAIINFFRQGNSQSSVDLPKATYRFLTKTNPKRVTRLVWVLLNLEMFHMLIDSMFTLDIFRSLWAFPELPRNLLQQHQPLGTQVAARGTCLARVCRIPSLATVWEGGATSQGRLYFQHAQSKFTEMFRSSPDNSSFWSFLI